MQTCLAGWTRAVRRKLWAAGSEISRERLQMKWRQLPSKVASLLLCLGAKLNLSASKKLCICFRLLPSLLHPCQDH